MIRVRWLRRGAREKHRESRISCLPRVPFSFVGAVLLMSAAALLVRELIDALRPDPELGSSSA